MQQSLSMIHLVDAMAIPVPEEPWEALMVHIGSDAAANHSGAWRGLEWRFRSEYPVPLLTRHFDGTVVSRFVERLVIRMGTQRVTILCATVEQADGGCVYRTSVEGTPEMLDTVRRMAPHLLAGEQAC